MSLGAKKLNSSKSSVTAKGVLSKAVLAKGVHLRPPMAKTASTLPSKNAAYKTVPAKALTLKVSAPKAIVQKKLEKVAAAKPVAGKASMAVKTAIISKTSAAQKIAPPSRAALVNKPNGVNGSKPNGVNGSKPNGVYRPNGTNGAIVIPKPVEKPIDPRFAEFYALLQAKRAELAASLGDTRLGAQAQNGRVAEEDQASVSHEEFISSKRNSMEFRMLRLVNAALDRIVRGEYAMCHACEEEISEKRLRAIPWAEFCVHCQDSHGAVDNDSNESVTPGGAAPALQVWNW